MTANVITVGTSCCEQLLSDAISFYHLVKSFFFFLISWWRTLKRSARKADNKLSIFLFASILCYILCWRERHDHSHHRTQERWWTLQLFAVFLVSNVFNGQQRKLWWCNFINRSQMSGRLFFFYTCYGEFVWLFRLLVKKYLQILKVCIRANVLKFSHFI